MLNRQVCTMCVLCTDKRYRRMPTYYLFQLLIFIPLRGLGKCYLAHRYFIHAEIKHLFLEISVNFAMQKEGSSKYFPYDRITKECFLIHKTVVLPVVPYHTANHLDSD